MAKQKMKRQRDVALPTPFEEARDELFQQIMQCGVIGADSAHQDDWFGETMAYLADRYHELSPVQLTELKTLGERVVQPPKSGPGWRRDGDRRARESRSPRLRAGFFVGGPAVSASRWAGRGAGRRRG